MMAVAVVAARMASSSSWLRVTSSSASRRCDFISARGSVTRAEAIRCACSRVPAISGGWPLSAIASR